MGIDLQYGDRAIDIFKGLEDANTDAVLTTKKYGELLLLVPV